MSHAVLKISNLSKIYRIYNRSLDRLFDAFVPFGRRRHADFHALKDVSFELQKGTCLGIVGLNGSGKSTLLQCIAGVLTPTKGEVSVSGTIAALLELGAGFNPEFTGLENIRFQCAIMGLTPEACENIIPQIADFADIGEFVHHPVKTYSSGMYVRLAFAVAITVDPDILIVDEALAVGDVRFQAKCLAKIREFRQNGKTLIFVSHDPAAVKSLCDRAILLDRGSLIADSTPMDVFNQYNKLIAEHDRYTNRRLDGSKETTKRFGNKKVRIEHVTMFNQQNQEAEVFFSGETVIVAIEVKAQEAIGSCSMGILFRNRMGQDIFGTNTFLLEQSFSLAAGEGKKIRFELPLDLGADIYTLTVAAHAGENHVGENFDWIDDVTVFRVAMPAGVKFTGSCYLKPVASVETI